MAADRPGQAGASTDSRHLAAALLVVALTAVATYALARFLVPALGVEPSSPLRFLPEFDTPGFRTPEPVEQQRYILAALAALVLPLVIALVLSSDRRVAHVRPWVGVVVEVAIVAVVLAAWVESQPLLEQLLPLASGTLGPIAVLATLAALWPHRDALLRWTAGSGRGLEAACLAVAVAGTGLLCLAGVYRDADIPTAIPFTRGHLSFLFSEAYAVVGGRTPLVDFTPQYTTLLPYLYAPLLSLRPMSIGLLTIVNTATTTVALTCGYGALRLLAGRPLRALALYLPAAALALLPMVQAGDEVTTVATLFAAAPSRLAGPLVCLLTVALLARGPAGRRGLLAAGAVGGLTLVNNFEFGLPALAALVAAAALSTQAGRIRPAATVRHLLPLAGGIAIAFAAFGLLSVIRGGDLPDPARAIYFSRQFAIAGVSMLPFGDLLGLAGIVFLTFVAAVAVGAAPALLGTRAMDRRGRTETAVLTFTGVFGVGAFAYFVGRSHPFVLVSVFCAWGFALAALALTSARRLNAPGGIRRAGAPLALLAVGLFAVAGAAALDRARYGLDQPGRILRDAPPPAAASSSSIDVARACVRPGTNVIVFLPYGLRIAEAARLHDHLPFNHPKSVVTFNQLDDVTDAMRRGDVRAVITGPFSPEIRSFLRSRGLIRRAVRTNLVLRPVTDNARTLSIWAAPGDPAVTCSGIA